MSRDLIRKLESQQKAMSKQQKRIADLEAAIARMPSMTASNCKAYAAECVNKFEIKWRAA